MRVPVSFPRCEICRIDYASSLHRDCSKGGTIPLEIDPETEIVYCPSCENSWVITASTYYCKCGHVFSAFEVAAEVRYIVSLAKIVADELKYQSLFESKRKKLGGISFGDFCISVLSNFGISIGYIGGVLEKIVKAVKSIFFH